MEDLEKAIKTLNSPGSTPSEKLNSLEVCRLVTESAEGWKICLRHLGTGIEEVRFWSVGSLIKMVGAFPGEDTRSGTWRLNIENRRTVREALIEFFRDGVKVRGSQGYMKNKISELYVILIYVDYPDNWPSAFLDVVSLVTVCDWMPEMFVRILNTFDKMIVSNGNMQSSEEIATRRKIKDVMRVNGDLNHIVQAWIFVVSKNKTLPLTKEVIELLSLSMNMMESFIDWIDISYAVNNEVLAIISSLLNPVESPIVLETLNFLTAILLKGMPPRLKIQLFKDLNISSLLENQISLNIKDISPEFFQTHILGKWLILKNPETISSIEQGPFGDIYKDFCLFLISFRSSFTLKVVGELFLSIRGLAAELETKNSEELAIFKTGMEILEAFLPSLNIIISVENTEFMHMKQEACRFLTQLASFFSSQDPLFSRLSGEFDNALFSNFVSGVLFTLLNGLKKPDSYYFFQMGSRETDIFRPEDSAKSFPDFGGLFFSLIELKPDIVCNFMDMILQNLTNDIQRLSFSQVDSISFLIAKFGQAALNEKRKILKSRIPSQLDTKFTISRHYIRFVESLLKSPEVIYFSCKCFKATESGIHREIFLRNSLLQIFKSFTDLIGTGGGGYLSFWDEGSQKTLTGILDILLSGHGILNPHLSISQQSSKSILGIVRSFSSHLIDYIPKFVLVLMSHVTMGSIIKLAEKGVLEDEEIESIRNGSGLKSLNLICEAIGTLLFSKFKSKGSIGEQQEVILQYEEVVQHLLNFSHKFNESISQSSKDPKGIAQLKWRSAVELVQMVSSISDGTSEHIPALCHLWRASLNVLLLLSRNSNFSFGDTEGSDTSILSPMHRLIRVMGPESCNYIVPITDSFLGSSLEAGRMNIYSITRNLRLSQSCEEISHFICHLVTLYGGSEELRRIFGSLVPELFTSMVKIWFMCWPGATSICNAEGNMASLIEDLLFSVEAHQARQSIQLSILKILNSLSKSVGCSDLLTGLCSTGGEQMNEARQILRELILNPAGATSSLGIKTYTNVVPCAFLFREALTNIQSPVLCFLVGSLLASLSTPIHWIEYSGDRHLFREHETPLLALEAITNIYLRILTKDLRTSHGSDISQDLKKLGIELTTSFLWFSILDQEKDGTFLGSQIGFLRLLVTGEVPATLVDKNSSKYPTKKPSQTNQSLNHEAPNPLLIPQDVVVLTREMVFSGTKAVFSQKALTTIQNSADAISFTRKSIELFSGYHYFILLSSIPNSGLLDESFEVLNKISHVSDSQFKLFLKKFVENYQSYVRQVL
ncbi:tRNA exportin type nuclear export protein [Cryptosporidium felis]|nr:tRNA exportin type nuclear export protein [Cryptosporidium felis]